jgi:MFS family permease
MKGANMKQNAHNVERLVWFAPFQNLSVSAAYLVPFFLEKGLSQTQIFTLQSIFSIAVVLWELPSGWLADRFGRALSIKLSVPLAGLAMTAYAFGDHWWQFVVCELLLAVANGLISGADTALLIDSLKADGREEQVEPTLHRRSAWGFASLTLGVPLATVLVWRFGVAATIVADGLITLVGFWVIRNIRDPDLQHDDEHERLGNAVRRIARNAEVRYVVLLGVALSTSTYLGFWLSATYYSAVGVPVVLFSALLAGRSLFKAWLSHRQTKRDVSDSALTGLVALSGLSYATMATLSPWLLLSVLAHDVVQARHRAPLRSRLNHHFSSRHRAALNSVVNLLERGAYAAVGPLVGLLVDKTGLRTSLVVTGFVCTAVAALALWQMRHVGRSER